jgi:deoxyadenosine/deoxycytidine kinase
MDFAKLLVPSQRPLHIFCAGLIGVGKSTLAKELAAYFNAELLCEPVEQNIFLQQYYAELADQNHAKPMNTAYPLQMALLAQRAAEVKRFIGTDRALVSDRSPYEDAIFVKMLENTGDMSHEQAASYLSLLNTCFSLLPEPTVIVWLKASPGECLRRIAARNRELEAKVPLEYLRQLNDAYQQFFDAMQGRLSVLVINREHASQPGTDEYDVEVLSIVRKIVQFRKDSEKRPYVD